MSSRRAFALPGLFMAAVIFKLPNCDVASAQGLNAAARVLRSPESWVMTLEPLSVEERAAQSLLKNPKTSQEVPEGFREFGTARAGEVVETKSLTVRFAAAATLTKIEGTPDFKIEQGGSCVEGYSYAANETCTLLVRFTPQGPGRRVGKLAVTNSVDAKPFSIGLGGYGYSPTISFTPSIISTVPGTYVGGAGIVSGATNIAVDGGDSLYIADTGHNEIELIDSSGTIQNATSAFGANAPIAVAVDQSGSLYFTQDTQYYFLLILPSANTETYYAPGSTSCAYGSTCDLFGAALQYSSLGGLALDPNGNVFLNTYQNLARLVPSPSVSSLDYIPLAPYYNYNVDYPIAPPPLAVDSSDTLYTYYNAGDGRECTILGTSYYNAENDVPIAIAAVGGRACGFSGDGGQARGAEIGKQVGQMTFDAAGNFYFADMLNQRVRRVDGSTGIITTIAGNGATGYAGDGGPATSAALDNPTGVAVDSQGQVYVISSSSTTGTAQVVRKVGTVGALNLGGLAVGSASTAQTVSVANTGNSNLDFTHVGFSSGNTSDFSMDVNTTSCSFTVPLPSGHSCKIGFIFKPTATGTRTAVLSITDDTIAGLNTIDLSGTGYTVATLTPASFTFASTNFGSSSAAQTATLKNTGTAAMTISSIAITGAAAASYADTTTCGTTLAAAASCTIAVTFKPLAAGTLSASLTVKDNALGGGQSVSLTGTSVAVAKASLSPTSLTFASTKVGAASTNQIIKLSNTGDGALGVTSITLTGADPTEFTFTDNCGTSVAAAGSCNISVTFKPKSTGTRTATVSIVSSVGTLTAALTGTSVAAANATEVTLSEVRSLLVDSKIVSLSAQVRGGPSVVPTGTIQLWEGSHMWVERDLVAGKAVFEMEGLPSGTHLLNALYLGNASDSESRSPDVKVIVALPTGVQLRPTREGMRSE